VLGPNQVRADTGYVFVGVGDLVWFDFVPFQGVDQIKVMLIEVIIVILDRKVELIREKFF